MTVRAQSEYLRREAGRPILASASGNAIMALCSAVVSAIVEAMAMQAIIEPQ